MSRDDPPEVFGSRRADPDWEMFCRRYDPAGNALSFADRLGVADGPVELAPSDDESSGEGEAIVRHFVAKVVGVGFPNEDGTSRRDAARGLRRMELVQLAHRPDNPVDANAVAVIAPNGRQVGYLRASLAKGVVRAARDEGTRYLALVHEVTGAGPPDLIVAGEQVGATLLVLALQRGATKAAARRYLLDLMNRSTRVSSKLGLNG